MKKILLLVTAIFVLIAILPAQNNCLDFDGTNDYVDCGNNSSLNPGTGSFTIEAWIKPDGLSGIKRFIWKNDGTEPPFNGYYFNTNGTTLQAGFSDDASSTQLDGGTLTVGSWHHVAAVRDVSAGKIRLYLNGVEINEQTDNTGSNSISCTDNLGIGGRTDLDEEMFDGLMDEVRIWSSARSETEISENMCQTLAGTKSDLVALYKFNESSGAIADNAQGTSALDGTLTNMEDVDWVDSEAYTTWDGSVGSVWTNDNNWTDGAPGSTDNIGIPNEGTAPIISSLIECNQLVVGSGVTLEFNYTGSHTIHGSAFVIGRSDIKNGNFLTVTKSLYILPLATLVIDPGGELTIGNKLVNWAACTIESTSAGTGSLIVGGTATGNDIYLQRWITGSSNDWHLLSSPVATQEIHGNFVDALGYDFYMYYEPENLWVNKKNTTIAPTWSTANGSNNFVQGRGYLVAYTNPNSNAKSFTGALNQGTISIALTKTGSGDYNGSNLIGNPYPSSIDWKASSGWTRSMLRDDDGAGIGYTMYIWNQSATNYGTFISNGTTGTNSVTQYIPPMQGFFVVAANAGAFQMTEDICVHNGASNWLKNTETTNELVRLKVINTNYGEDEVVIEFNDNATGGAPKMMSMVTTAPSLWLDSNNKLYSILFASQDQKQNAFPLSFKAGADAIYQINIDSEIKQFETITLEDKKLNTLHDLTQNPVYEFFSYENDDVNRFIVHFGPLSINDIQLSEQINVFAADNKIEIRSNKPIDATINIYNISGQLITASQLNNESSTSVDIPNYKGVAIVSIVTSGQTLTEKVIVW